MKVKYTIDRSESGSKKENAVKDIIRKLGSRATVRGSEIEVDTSYERDVADVLNRAGLKYSRR